MEGEAAAAVLQTLVQNLIDLCKKEISQIRGLRKDAAKLAGSLDMIKNYLKDAETRNITSDAVKSWLKKLEDVVFDADNVLDELNYHILSKQIKATKPLKAKVLSSFSRFKHISRSRNMALKIKEINENLESIKKEAAELRLVEKLDNEPTLVIASLETDSHTHDPIFIGREDVESEIVEMLTNSITTDERSVSIISIVGMGGLGKTTLTRKVFNHLKDEKLFGLYIWVHVSQIFDPIILLKKILDVLTSHQVENASREVILTKLEGALKEKTYLLVLDDVWNEDLCKWQDFFNSLLGVTSAKGNAIVVTTRIMNVASVVNPLRIHSLKGLSEEECWSIIKAKAFGKDVPSEFEAIGKNIAKRCQGLPLAANVVGGILSNQSEEKWRSIEEKWLSPKEGGDNIMEILRLSFDNLSLPSLKKCFAYCAMFPKGFGIIKQGLIEMWMAEGFLQADERDDMESVGEKFINVLLHNSLLQVSWRDLNGNVKKCGMHDLVHDLACSVSSSSNSGSSRVRYMTLGDDYCGEESSPISKEMAKYLRTLLFEGDISGINFANFESLHVLGFDSGVEKLSSSIQKLIHLRHFDMSKTILKVLPDWIGEFFHLQTLRVNSPSLEKLPSTIKYLINLRHLYINRDVELPMGIGECEDITMLGQLPNLKSLKLKGLSNLKCIISSLDGMMNNETSIAFPALESFELKRMPKLTQWVEISDGSEVKLFPHLQHLKIKYCEQLMSVPMLGHLQKLKSLKLEGLSNLKCINSSFYGMVNNDTRIVFPALERFELRSIDNLAEWAEIEILDGSEVKVLPRLQYLNIIACKQLKSVPSLVSSCLERLWIYNIGVEYLPGDWFLSSNQTLSSLEISECSNLRELISDRGGEQSQGTSFTSLPIIFPRLKEVIIWNCEQLMSVPSLVSSCLERLTIHKIGVECLPADWLFSNSETLSHLEISECPNLREISDRGGKESQGRSFTSLPIFPQLTHLEIINCKQLMSVPSVVSSCLEYLEISGIDVEFLPGDWFLSSNQTLSYLCIDDCPNLREISDRGGEQSQGTSFTSLPIIFPRLKELKIKWCEQLMSVPSLVSSCLEELEICGIGVEYLLGDWFLSSNQTLSKLEIVKCPNLREISDRGGEQSQGTSFTSLPIFSRLTHLTIWNCEQLKSVPSLVSSCLEELEINGIGVKYLHGDWFLSSNQTLSTLQIVNCPNLREISDRGGEQSQGRSFTSLPIFPRLTTLIICTVPKLSLETVDAMRRLQIHGYKRIDPDGITLIRGANPTM